MSRFWSWLQIQFLTRSTGLHIYIMHHDDDDSVKVTNDTSKIPGRGLRMPLPHPYCPDYFLSFGDCGRGKVPVGPPRWLVVMGTPTVMIGSWHPSKRTRCRIFHRKTQWHKINMKEILWHSTTDGCLISKYTSKVFIWHNYIKQCSPAC